MPERFGTRKTKRRGTIATVDIAPIIPVIAHAVAVFGDEHKASHWLATPLAILGNRSPSHLLTTQAGGWPVFQLHPQR